MSDKEWQELDEHMDYMDELETTNHSLRQKLDIATKALEKTKQESHRDICSFKINRNFPCDCFNRVVNEALATIKRLDEPGAGDA